MTWAEIRAAEDARVRASGHASLCADAVKIMPSLSADSAPRVRLAMLAGPGRGLRELIMPYIRPRQQKGSAL